MGPPSVNIFMARIEDLFEVNLSFSIMKLEQEHHLRDTVRSSTE